MNRLDALSLSMLLCLFQNSNAAKVIVSGTGIEENAICQEENNLVVDMSDAGNCLR